MTEKGGGGMEILLGFLANANSAIIGDNGGNSTLTAKNVNLVVIVILAMPSCFAR